jgi:drug/metabolite transporter (DMT)-like permease
MEPVFAALSAFVMIHEIMTPLAIVGSGLILVGMVVAELGGQEKVLQQTI